ncbi:TetR/AcrR family transcriptional regulator [Nocardia bovistercoris]|uniref:TetR/AcrR family transcriptional regulator n=1 Tax=Nocardia bovistercoris TaxID=2785916 RepID=A0A931N5E3_9NOCA|nr:TetR/AcrR family transcriptional regulator [Nocardia bovistercoris]MBH0779632.1 TetR/AcrR family transcriptional regulator [Nocardia bovistercoris]
MGRTSDARQRLLAAAGDLMHRRGYAAIGVAEICARAEVRKGSFYHFFPSKEALSIAAIDAYWEAQRPEWLAARDRADDPSARLESLIHALIEAQRAYRETTGNLGCMLVNVGIELSDREPSVRARIREILDEQTALVADIVVEIDRDTTLVTARAVLAQLEGALLFAKLHDDPSLLDHVWAQIRRILDAAGDRAGVGTGGDFGTGRSEAG